MSGGVAAGLPAGASPPEAASAGSEPRASHQLLATVVLSACVGLVGGALAAWPIYHALGPAERTIVPAGPASGGVSGGKGGGSTVTSLVQSELGAVVKIATKQVSNADLLAGGTGLATGFVASQDGLVITTAHALAGQTALSVITQDGRVYPALLVDSDPAHGLAILRASGATNLPTLSFASSAPQPGDYAIALGSPPFTQVSVTSGSVSSTGRTLSNGSATVFDVTTIDAVASPQDDGAPVLDGAGNVIGVEVAAAADGAPGMVALSGRDAAALFQRASGGSVRAQRGSFGPEAVVLDNATAAAAGVDRGALVRTVVPDGPADQAGLQAGDVVSSVAGTAVDAAHGLDPSSFSLDVGQPVTMQVERAGVHFTVTLTVGAG